MKTRGPHPLALLTYFVLCLTTWIVFQAELGRGGSPDVFWFVALFLLFLLFWRRLRSKPKELRRGQEGPGGAGRSSDHV